MLNAFISIKEMDFIIRYLLAKKAPNPDSFTSEFYPTFKDEIVPFHTQTLRRKECFPAHMKPASSWYQNLIMTL